jgi:hypothetical protein
MLARQYDVVALDLSGHGESGRRPEYPRRQWADEVLAVVRRTTFGTSRRRRSRWRGRTSVRRRPLANGEHSARGDAGDTVHHRSVKYARRPMAVVLVGLDDEDVGRHVVSDERELGGGVTHGGVHDDPRV